MQNDDIISLYVSLTHATVGHVDKPWGWEKIIHVQERRLYIKLIHIDEGKRVSLQSHPEGIEVIFILEGDGTVEGTPDAENGQPRPSPGYFVDQNQIHRSVGPVTLLEFTTAGPDDIVRHEDDHGRAGTIGA